MSVTWQHSTTVAGGPGSRAKTSRSGSPIPGYRHIGVCNASAARLEAQITGGTSPRRRYRIVWRDLAEPGEAMRAVGTQSGRCAGAFFWKKNSPSTPSGYRLMVTGRDVMYGSRTGELPVE